MKTLNLFSYRECERLVPALALWQEPDVILYERLRPVEVRILAMRYGLRGFSRMALRDIAETFGVKLSCITYHHRHALRALQQDLLALKQEQHHT